MLRERAAAHGIELGVEIADGVGSVYSDELRLKQVLLNLVTNAVKFTGDGGSVTVRAAREGAEILITVTDTGIGVPEADRERIFESFQQGGRGSSREEGTGLGLTLSRRLVELLGGRMWLESEVGRGSTFGFSLPAREERALRGPGRLEEGPRRPRCGRRHRGRPAVARPLQRLPVGRGARRSPRRATGPPASTRYVVPGRTPSLLDIRLPGIDGWAVLRALKAERGDPRHPGRSWSPSSTSGPAGSRWAPRRTWSSRSAGTTCSPRWPPSARRCAAGGRPDHTGGVMSRGRVLVVEDNPKNLKLVRDVLTYSGFEVIEATSGEEGVRLAEETMPDLVLMDLQLPGIDGAEALRQIRLDRKPTSRWSP